MSSDAKFPDWFFFGMLRAAGWPRKTGLRRREVVNAIIADGTADQLLGIGLIIGAGKPELGLALIGDGFIDWSEEQAGRHIEFLEETLKISQPGPPKLDIFPPHLRDGDIEDFRANVWWRTLTSDTFRMRLNGEFLSSVWYGVLNSQEVKQDFDQELSGAREQARQAVRRGLDVDPETLPTSATEHLEQALSAIREFEGAVGPLSKPPGLLVEAAHRFRQEF